MITKFRNFLLAGVVIASLPLLSTANNGNGQGKTTLCHNGHEITIANPAVEHHLNNHNKPGAKLTCYRGPCHSNPTPQPPPPPCQTCPPKPPCNGCI